MQTSKLFPAVSAAVLLAALVSPKIFAQDSDAQQKAREALRQKMSELDASKAPDSTPKAVTPPPASAPAKSAPEPARVTTPPPPPASTPEPVVAPKATTPPPAAAVPAAAPAAQATDAEGSEKARAALREKMNQLDSQPTTATAPATAPKSTAKAAPTSATTASNKAAQPVPSTLRALETPAPAISASKEARLAELLQKYKADAITPEEYHTKRAAIRAEP